MEIITENDYRNIKHDEDKYYIDISKHIEERTILKICGVDGTKEYELPEGKSSIKKERLEEKSVFIQDGSYMNPLKIERREDSVSIKLPEFMDNTYFESLISKDTDEVYNFNEGQEETKIDVNFRQNVMEIENLAKGATYEIIGRYKKGEVVESSGLEELFNDKDSDKKFKISDIDGSIDVFDITYIGEEVEIRKPKNCFGRVKVIMPFCLSHSFTFLDGKVKKFEIPKPDCIKYKQRCEDRKKPKIKFETMGKEGMSVSKIGLNVDFTEELPVNNKYNIDFPNWIVFDSFEESSLTGVILEKKGVASLTLSPDNNNFRPIFYIQNNLELNRIELNDKSNTLEDEKEINIGLIEIDIYLSSEWENVEIKLFNSISDNKERIYHVGDFNKPKIKIMEEDTIIIKGDNKEKKISLSEEEKKYTRAFYL